MLATRNRRNSVTFPSIIGCDETEMSVVVEYDLATEGFPGEVTSIVLAADDPQHAWLGAADVYVRATSDDLERLAVEGEDVAKAQARRDVDRDAALAENETDRQRDDRIANCPHCGGEGSTDSGGVTPWGEWISIPCICVAAGQK